MDKSLCDICGITLRLSTRSTDIKQNNVQLIESLLADETAVENFLPIDIQALTSSEHFKALPRSNRTKLLEIIPQSSVIYYQTCKNKACGQTKMLPNGTLIYRQDRSVQQRVDTDYSRYRHSKILPKTAKYKCTNPNCKTHQNPELRNAIFFRTKNTLQLVYICLECDHYWEHS